MRISADRRGPRDGRIKSHKSFKINTVEEHQMSQEETKFMDGRWKESVLHGWGEKKSVSD